jgi:hypothetical protein
MVEVHRFLAAGLDFPAGVFDGGFVGEEGLMALLPFLFGLVALRLDEGESFDEFLEGEALLFGL